MQEALEKWDLSLLSSVCPKIVSVMKKIDARFRREMKKAGKEIKPDENGVYTIPFMKLLGSEHNVQLERYAENCRFANCRAEAGYLKALGLAVPPRA